MIFTVYVDLDVGTPVKNDTEAVFAAAFRPDDDGTCVWTDQRQPNLLRASFDLEARNFEQAIEAARGEVVAALAETPIHARPIAVVAMNDEAQASWTEQ